MSAMLADAAEDGAAVGAAVGAVGAAAGAVGAALAWGWYGAGDHPLESASLLPFRVYRPVYVVQPGACIQRPRMRPIRRRHSSAPRHAWRGSATTRADRRRLRSDDQPGHSQLSGRLRSADNRTPRLAHPRQLGSLRSELWQRLPRRSRGGSACQRRRLAPTECVQNPTYWAV